MNKQAVKARESGLSQIPPERARTYLESCHRRIAVGLSLHSHTGERALCPVKTQVKISGRHQSEYGAAHWLTVRSYLDSTRKHGLRAFEAIHRAFTDNLWMPPVALDA